MKNYKEILSQIKTFIFDVDGVLTDGSLTITTNGEMLRTRNFGRKSLNEIKEILDNMELHLGVKLEAEDIKQITQQAKKKKEVEVEVVENTL